MRSSDDAKDVAILVSLKDSDSPAHVYDATVVLVGSDSLSKLRSGPEVGDSCVKFHKLRRLKLI